MGRKLLLLKKTVKRICEHYPEWQLGVVAAKGWTPFIRSVGDPNAVERFESVRGALRSEAAEDNRSSAGWIV